MNYDEMTFEQLEEELNKADAERQAAKERGRAIMEVRTRKIMEENALAHGLTAEDYAALKRHAAEQEKPFLTALNDVRREAVRQLQTARPQAARVGAKGKGA
jgi:hypothetical protein